jgi:hypothetical protein
MIYNRHQETKKNKVGGACVMCEGEDRCIKGFGA